MKWLIRVGLGALTIGMGGMAWGQGATYNDIPAPDLYGDITGCVSMSPMSVLTPALFGPNAGKSTLDLALEPGNAVLGTGITAGMLTPCTTNTNSVSQGINQARVLYREAAQARASAMLEGASQDAIDDYNEANAEKEAYGGAVYDKVYAESAAHAAADKAIRDYNALFATDDDIVADGDTRGVYTKAVAEFSDLVINNLDTADAAAMNTATYVNTYGKDAIRGFQPIAGVTGLTPTAYDAATVAAGTAYDWGTAFDAATGELEFEINDAMPVRSDPNDPTSPITTYNNGADGSTTITTLGQLKGHLDAWNAIVRATAKAVADADPDTTSATTLALYRLDAARAVVARDHVQDEWDRLTAVVRRVDRNRNVDGQTSDSDKLDAYDMAKRTVSRHGSNVRTTIGALEAATKELSDSLTSADDFLSQVVSSAKYSQSQLDDDATDRQVAAAAKAVTDAEAALAAHMALTGDADNPAVALLDALLKPDTVRGEDNPEDDDGQALVNAISSNYATAKAAKDAADAAKAATDGLTGEDGKIADIEAKLAQKKEYIDNLAGEIGMDPVTGEGTADDMGNTRIDLNEARSMANETAIAANAGNIATNAGNIATNAMNIMENSGMIESNTAAIGANAAMLMDHAGMISANASAISANSSTLSMHTQQISGLVDEMEVVKAGVAAGIAMASMPAVQGNGVSLGVGSFDGESAFAVGYQYGGERINFQIGVSSSGGETGAGAGISFAIGQ